MLVANVQYNAGGKKLKQIGHEKNLKNVTRLSTCLLSSVNLYNLAKYPVDKDNQFLIMNFKIVGLSWKRVGS